MLWSVEGENLSGTSFLFGTMHVRDSRMFDSVGFVCEKIRDCQAYAAEFNLDEAAIENPVRLNLQLPEGQSLQQLIPPKKYRKVRSILLKSAGIDIDFFQKAPPFFIVNLIAERILLTDMPVSLDEFLWNFAKKQGKSMHGVETFREQLEVLEKITLTDQVKMLQEMCQNIGRYHKHLLHMADLYQKNEVQRLFKTVKKNSKGLRKILLYRRNEVMAERIAGLASQQAVFVAVGAAHLGGQKGVIKLLKMRGLKVKPVQVPTISSPMQTQSQA